MIFNAIQREKALVADEGRKLQYEDEALKHDESGFLLSNRNLSSADDPEKNLSADEFSVSPEMRIAELEAALEDSELARRFLHEAVSDLLFFYECSWKMKAPSP